MSKNKILKMMKEEGIQPSSELIKLIEEVSSKDVRYGLVWEDHPEPIYEKLKVGDHLIEEFKDKELKTDASDQVNFLFEGDNLQTLMLLKEQGVKVDVIYIDPPYNIGADVRYGDKFYDKDDEFAHSKWLSFMSKRLELARDVLADDGVIYISIDDGEQAQLKLLMDNIFGETNFIGMSLRKTRSISNNSRVGYSNEHDYLIIYGKDSNLIKLKGSPKDFSSYKNPDNDPKGRWVSSDPTVPAGNQNYPITNPFTQEVSYPPVGRGWGFKEEQLDELVSSGRIVFSKDGTKGGRGFIYKRYLNEVKNQDLPVSSLELTDNKYLNQAGTKNLVDIFKESLFEFPKPYQLVEKVISMHPKKDALVLDFFAGSGTTGQAVMELNRKDGGNRRFILATNNEVKESDAFDLWIEDNELEGLEYTAAGAVRNTDSNNKLIKEFMDSEEFKEFYESDEVQAKGICREVTYERIRRVAEGDYASGKKVEPLPINLKYYKLDVDSVKQDKEKLLEEAYRRQVVGVMINQNATSIEEGAGYTILKGDGGHIAITKEVSMNEALKAKVSNYNISQENVFSLCGLHEDFYFIKGDEIDEGD